MTGTNYFTINSTIIIYTKIKVIIRQKNKSGYLNFKNIYIIPRQTVVRSEVKQQRTQETNVKITVSLLNVTTNKSFQHSILHCYVN